MAKVTFVQAYRGYLTNERYFDVGETADIDEATASVMVERGIVAITATETPQPEKPKGRAKK